MMSLANVTLSWTTSVNGLLEINLFKCNKGQDRGLTDNRTERSYPKLG